MNIHLNPTVQPQRISLGKPGKFLIWLAFSFIIALLLTSTAKATENAPLIPYRAIYDFSWRNIKVGNSQHTLQKLGKDRYIGEALTVPNFQFLPFRSLEKSFFKQKNNALYPLDYSYENQEESHERIGRILFDWKKKKIKIVDGASIPDFLLSNNTQDIVTENLQLRLDLQTELPKGKKSFSYRVIQHNKVRENTFNVIAEEKIETPIGTLDTVKVEHISQNKKRRTFLWFSKEHQFLLVRMQQIRNNGLTLDSMIQVYQRL